MRKRQNFQLTEQIILEIVDAQGWKTSIRSKKLYNINTHSHEKKGYRAHVHAQQG